MADKYEKKIPLKEAESKAKKGIGENYQFRADSVGSEPKIRYALPHVLRRSSRSKNYTLSQSQGPKNYTLSQSQGVKNEFTVQTNGDGDN